jgi:hypothetical protein
VKKENPGLEDKIGRIAAKKSNLNPVGLKNFTLLL